MHTMQPSPSGILRLIAFLGAVLPIGAVLAAEQSGQPGPAKLVQVMEDQAYAAAASGLLGALDIATVSRRVEPDSGVALERVNPGSPAERLGITTGDIITSLDGLAIVDFSSINPLRTSHPQQLGVWSEAAGGRVLTIQPGLLGVDFKARRWQAELTYVRSGSRVPAWDRDMLIACLAEPSAVDLRETALARVQAAGGRPSPWLSLAAAVELARGRSTEALACARLAREEETDLSAKTRIGALMFQAALAAGRLADARAAAEWMGISPNPRESRAWIIAALDRALAQEPDAGSLPLLSLKGPSETLIDMRGRIQGSDDGGRMAAEILHRNEKFPFRVSSDHYIMVTLGPLARECSLLTSFVYEAAAPGQGKFVHSIRCGILDESDPNAPRLFCSVNIDDGDPGVVIISRPDLPTCRIRPDSEIGAKVVNRIRVTAIGEALEVAVNGTALFHARTGNAATRRVGCYLHMSGVDGSCPELSWRIDAASAAAADAPGATPVLPAGANDF